MAGWRDGTGHMCGTARYRHGESWSFGVRTRSSAGFQIGSETELRTVQPRPSDFQGPELTGGRCEPLLKSDLPKVALHVPDACNLLTRCDDY